MRLGFTHAERSAGSAGSLERNFGNIAFRTAVEAGGEQAEVDFLAHIRAIEGIGVAIRHDIEDGVAADGETCGYPVDLFLIVLPWIGDVDDVADLDGEARRDGGSG